MVNRRSLLLSMLVAPLPFAAAVAQPWWDERARRAEWERYQEEERRRRHEARREAWDERREHEEWERRRRDQARLEWEREHGPYRR